MAISFACPQCNHALSIKDALAGRKGTCPKCKAVIQVPTLEPTASKSTPENTNRANTAASGNSLPSPSASPFVASTVSVSSSATAPVTTGLAPATVRQAGAKWAGTPQTQQPSPQQPTPQQIYDSVISCFQGQFPPHTLSRNYQFGALLAIGFLLLMPSLYLGLILLVLWDVVTTSSMISIIVLVLLCLLPPLVLLKPLLSGRSRESRTRSLTRDSDPILFAFVDRICDVVQSPKPSRINVDCDINASAYRGRNQFVLTLGMPLVSGLSLQQFAGVLAHEFGHFSQDTGMRLTFVLRSITGWFGRVVYDRDSWDDWLEHCEDSPPIHALRFFVWFTRRILWCQMMLCQMVCGYLLRQMEFDADTYEARLVGSDTFGTTCRRLRLLGFAWEGAKSDLSEFRREGRLADNLPKLIMNNLTQMPAEVHNLVEEVIEKSQTRWYESHPADRDRILAAEFMQTPGVFRTALPSTVLFRDFDHLAKSVTWDFYSEIFGKQLKPSDMHPVESLIAQQNVETEYDAARKRFFGNAYAALRPLRLPSGVLQTVTDAEPLNARITALRQAVEQSLWPYREYYQQYDQFDTQGLRAIQATPLLNNGVRFQPADDGICFGSSFEAHRGREQAEGQLARLAQAMTPFEQWQGERLYINLCLLFYEPVASLIPNVQQMQQQAPRFLELVARTATHMESILGLRACHAVQSALLGHLEGSEQNGGLIREILDFSGRMHRQILEFREIYVIYEYPFEHGTGNLRVSDYLVKSVPLPSAVGDIYEAGDDVLTNLLSLYHRSLSRLCLMAEHVEAAVGMSPITQLPDPPRK